MKKIVLALASVMMLCVVACDNAGKAPKLENEADSLSYALGLANGGSMRMRYAMMGELDTTNIEGFLKGLQEGLSEANDTTKKDYYAGLQLGLQFGRNLTADQLEEFSRQLFGADSTQNINGKLIVAGILTAVKGGENAFMQPDKAGEYVQQKFDSLQSARQAEAEAEQQRYKKENEDYMAQLANNPDLQVLDSAIYYQVLTEGTGAIPADTSRVKVKYEGRLIDGTIFDSTNEDDQPRSFQANQVIDGWTTVLTHMPVGSKWKVYIPWDKAYGQYGNGSVIKPYSTLVFTIELIEIEGQE
ncbi:MAG: FKBP-type peptidyl-prolyl cis-trans isomerase [Bacteroidaceae bacterium]|nr:FKBP-type peptidyl-prolyl cis-trans isomerase [Bacteroidaceae bacterium]